MSSTPTGHRVVAAEAMREVYERAATPFKYGVMLQPPVGTAFDCPSIFRFADRWYMLFVVSENNVGYQTHLAVSEDLLSWQQLGAVLSFRQNGWDACQACGGIGLVDHQWEGSCAPRMFNDRYWLSYFGGSLKGYEPDPLAIGLATTLRPHEAVEWDRLKENPVLAPDQAGARPFEKKTLYKSTVIWDGAVTLGEPFVMFYNGKQEGPGTERIGVAISGDMIHWRRVGDGPVINNGPRGISGDPQIVRMNDLWVMFYFGHVWKPKAFDTFACSYDLLNWTCWDGTHLVEPSEPWDATFAHKPWVINWRGVVYHFYCAVGDRGRVIALATSRDLRE